MSIQAPIELDPTSNFFDVFKRILGGFLDGNPNSYPALLALITILVILFSVFALWTLSKFFKSELDNHRLQTKEVMEALKKSEESSLSFRDRAQDKIEALVTRYQEDRQASVNLIQSNFNSLRDTLAQLLGTPAASRRDFDGK